MNIAAQLLIIVGSIVIILFAIWALKGISINAPSNNKIQALAITGLAIGALIALIASIIASIYYKNEALVGVNLDKGVQILIISGIIIIAVASIIAVKVRSVNMRSSYKIQAIALLGLTSVAVMALIAIIFSPDKIEGLIGVASAAVGGVAGFVSQKLTSPNRTVLSPISDQHVIAGDTLKFSVAGVSTAGYNLNYNIYSEPDLPPEAKFDTITGEFNWATKAEDEEKEYKVTFTVSDGMGGTDSRTIKITVYKKIKAPKTK